MTRVSFCLKVGFSLLNASQPLLNVNLQRGGDMDMLYTSITETGDGLKQKDSRNVVLAGLGNQCCGRCSSCHTKQKAM